ncbi:MAG: YbaN family protein [Chloroflexi bacterium]|nr:YbaN family protein [Chloroflexota bacterium]
MMKKINSTKTGLFRKSVWILGGTICIGLGLIGVLFPILPTTPFLLLAAFCYARGSKRIYHWLVYQSWAGATIQNYQSGHGIPPKQKAFTIALLWLTIGSTIYLVPLAWWLKIVLVAVATGVTIHLARMKNCQPAMSLQAVKKQLMDPMETMP